MDYRRRAISYVYLEFGGSYFELDHSASDPGRSCLALEVQLGLIGEKMVLGTILHRVYPIA